MEKERLDEFSPREVLENCLRSLKSKTGSSKASRLDSDSRHNRRAVSY
uniref:Uncharacterized protein n=1 Tax=Nelumbo nucifera TaxID=4432 RepID=A0A822Z0Z2_NELNU|nr:TPA_asm: hypothetical protein HUJ06_008814 [Nelumbo nucifera]